MARALPDARWRLAVFTVLALGPGCTMVPRSQVADCQRTAQALRAENARYRDQLLAFQAQNRDYADRAVDDYRRLAAQEETIAQLQESNHAYQNERNQLEAAFKQLKANLAGDLGATSSTSTSDVRAWPSTGSRSASAANKNAAASRAGKNGESVDQAKTR